MGLKGSLETILNNIELAKQNSSIKKEVIVVAASKTRAFSLIEEVYLLGIRHIGENRIQEAVGKFKSFEKMPNITRRFIGHLQSNKINKFIELPRDTVAAYTGTRTRGIRCVVLRRYSYVS